MKCLPKPKHTSSTSEEIRIDSRLKVTTELTCRHIVKDFFHHGRMEPLTRAIKVDLNVVVSVLDVKAAQHIWVTVLKRHF